MKQEQKVVLKYMSIYLSIVGIICLSIFHFVLQQDTSTDIGQLFFGLTLAFLPTGLAIGIHWGFIYFEDDYGGEV